MLHKVVIHNISFRRMENVHACKHHSYAGFSALGMHFNPINYTTFLHTCVEVLCVKIQCLVSFLWSPAWTFMKEEVVKYKVWVCRGRGGQSSGIWTREGRVQWETEFMKTILYINMIKHTFRAKFWRFFEGIYNIKGFLGTSYCKVFWEEPTRGKVRNVSKLTHVL